MVGNHLIFRIDEPDRPCESLTQEILRNNATDAAGLGAGAEQRNGRRLEQAVEVANGHDEDSQTARRDADASDSRIRSQNSNCLSANPAAATSTA